MNSTGVPRVISKVRAGLASYNRYQLGVLILLTMLFLTAPLLFTSSIVFVLVVANIWAIFAMSWDLMSGHTGYISFGHSLLSGASAYTTALVALHVSPSVPVYVTFPLSVAVAIVVGLLFAVPALRVRGPYFALLTFVALLIAERLIFVFSEYTEGELGITAVPSFDITLTQWYYVSLLITLLSLATMLFISHSHQGHVLIGIRENEEAIAGAGLNTTKLKVWAFSISAFFMGIGGALLGHFYGTVSPGNVLVVERTIEMITIAVIGGLGTISGPMISAYLLLLLRDWFLRGLLDSTHRYVVFWVIVLILMLTAREGIVKPAWKYLGSLGEESDNE